jgi:hypothetical protein
MYNKRIMDCLYGLVGWYQNQNPDYPQLSPSLLQSDSGLYVQDEHPLLCIENLDQALKNYDHYNYASYAALTAYNEGDRVRASDNVIYESLDDANTGNDPAGGSFPLLWQAVPLLSQRLEQVMRASINRLNATMFNRKKISEVVKTLVEKTQLYAGVGNLLDKEIKMSRFVGLQITLEQSGGIAVILRKLGTQFSLANPDFKLYVYHSSQVAPLAVYTKALTKAGSFEWTPLTDGNNDPLTLNYLNNEYAPGGVFYIGYYEDDLVGQAINNAYDFSKEPACGSCSNNLALYRMWSGYLSVTPFYVNPGDLNGTDLWDINKNQYTYTRNYGLNLDISVRCDVTDIFCQERDMFADAIIKQVAVDLLSIIANSTRNNAISKETQQLALYELNKPDNRKESALYRLDEAIKAISFDFSELNEVCLPCNHSSGVSWGTVS